MDSLSSLHEDDEASKPELAPKPITPSTSTSSSSPSSSNPSSKLSKVFKSGLDLETHIKKIISQNEAIIDPLWNKKYSSSSSSHRHHSTSSLPRGSHPFGTVGTVFGQSTCLKPSSGANNLASGSSSSTSSSSASSANLIQQQQQQFGANVNNSNPIDFSMNSGSSSQQSHSNSHQLNYPPMSINTLNYPVHNNSNSKKGGNNHHLHQTGSTSLEDEYDSYVRRRYSDITFNERRASIGSRLQSALTMGKPSSSSSATTNQPSHRPVVTPTRSPTRKLAIAGAINPYESVIKSNGSGIIVNPYEQQQQHLHPSSGNYVIGTIGGNGSDCSGSLVRDLLTSKVPIVTKVVTTNSLPAGKSANSFASFAAADHPENPERSVIKDLLLKARESNNNNTISIPPSSAGANSPPNWNQSSSTSSNVLISGQERKRSSPSSSAAVNQMNTSPAQPATAGQEQEPLSMLYYVCTICQIAFRNKENLSVHQSHYCKGAAAHSLINAPMQSTVSTFNHNGATSSSSLGQLSVTSPVTRNVMVDNNNLLVLNNGHEMSRFVNTSPPNTLQLPGSGPAIGRSNSYGSRKSSNKSMSTNSSASGQRSSSGASNTIFGGSGPGIVTVINDHVQRKISVMEMSPSVLHRRLTEGRTNTNSSSNTTITGDKQVKTGMNMQQSSPPLPAAVPSMAIGVDQQMLFNNIQGQQQQPFLLVNQNNTCSPNKLLNNNNNCLNNKNGKNEAKDGQPTLGMILKSTLESGAKKRKISEPVFPSHRTSSFINLPTIIEPASAAASTSTRDAHMDMMAGQRSEATSPKVVQKSSGSFGSGTSSKSNLTSNHNQRAFSVGSRPQLLSLKSTSGSRKVSLAKQSMDQDEEMMIDEENEQLMREIVSKSANQNNPRSLVDTKMDNNSIDSDDDEELVVDDVDEDYNNKDKGNDHERSIIDGQGYESEKVDQDKKEVESESIKKGSGSPWTKTTTIPCMITTPSTSTGNNTVAVGGGIVEVLPEYLPFMKVPETKITIEGQVMFPVLERILTKSQQTKEETSFTQCIKGHQDQNDEEDKDIVMPNNLCKSLPPLIQIQNSSATASTSLFQQNLNNNIINSSLSLLEEKERRTVGRSDNVHQADGMINKDKEKGAEEDCYERKNEHRPCSNGVNETSQVVSSQSSLSLTTTNHSLLNAVNSSSSSGVQPCSSPSSSQFRILGCGEENKLMIEKEKERVKERIVQKVMQVPSIELSLHDHEIIEEKEERMDYNKNHNSSHFDKLKVTMFDDKEKVKNDKSELVVGVKEESMEIDEMELDEGREKEGNGSSTKTLANAAVLGSDNHSVTCYNIENVTTEQGQHLKEQQEQFLIDSIDHSNADAAVTTMDGNNNNNEYGKEGMNCLIKDNGNNSCSQKSCCIEENEAGKSCPCNNQTTTSSSPSSLFMEEDVEGDIETISSTTHVVVNGTEINNNCNSKISNEEATNKSTCIEVDTKKKHEKCFDGQSLKKDINMSSGNKCSFHEKERKEKEEEGSSSMDCHNHYDYEKEERKSSEEEKQSPKLPEGGENILVQKRIISEDTCGQEGVVITPQTTSSSSITKKKGEGKEEEEGSKKSFSSSSSSLLEITLSDGTRTSVIQQATPPPSQVVVSQSQSRPSTLDFLFNSSSSSNDTDATTVIRRRRRYSTSALITSTIVSPDTPRPKRPFSQQYLNGHAYTTLGLKVSTRSTFCCIYRPQPMFVHQEMDPNLSMYSNWQVSPSPSTGSQFLDSFPPKQLLQSYNSNTNQSSPNHENGLHYTPCYKLGINSGQQPQQTMPSPHSFQSGPDGHVQQHSSNNPMMAAMISTDSKYWTTKHLFDHQQQHQQQNHAELRTRGVCFEDGLGHFRKMSNSANSSEFMMSPNDMMRKMSEDRMTIGSDHSGASFSCNAPGCIGQYCHIPHSHLSASAASGSSSSGSGVAGASGTTSGADQPKRVKIFEGGFKSNEDYTYVRGRGRGKYVCEECGIRCKKPSMLKKHIRTHTDLRPYSCRHCAFAFKTKGNLTKHMKSKAHHKKCVEMGILPVPTSIDETQIDAIALAKQEAMERSFSGGHPLMSDEDDDNEMDEDGEYDDDDVYGYDEGSDDEGVPIPLTHPSFQQHHLISNNYNHHHQQQQQHTSPNHSSNYVPGGANYYSSPEFKNQQTARKISMDSLSPSSFGTSRSLAVSPTFGMNGENRCRRVSMTLTPTNSINPLNCSIESSAGMFKTCAGNQSKQQQLPHGLNNNNSNNAVKSSSMEGHYQTSMNKKGKEEKDEESLAKESESGEEEEEAVVAAQSLLTLSGSWTESDTNLDKQQQTTSSKKESINDGAKIPSAAAASEEESGITVGTVSKVTSETSSNKSTMSTSSSLHSPTPKTTLATVCPASSPPSPPSLVIHGQHQQQKSRTAGVEGGVVNPSCSSGPSTSSSSSSPVLLAGKVVVPSLPWTSSSPTKGDQMMKMINNNNCDTLLTGLTNSTTTTSMKQPVNTIKGGLSRGGGAIEEEEEFNDHDHHSMKKSDSSVPLIKSPSQTGGGGSGASTINKSRKISILESTLNNWNPYTTTTTTASPVKPSLSGTSSSRPRSYSLNDRILCQTKRNNNIKSVVQQGHHSSTSSHPVNVITTTPSSSPVTAAILTSPQGTRLVTNPVGVGTVTSIPFDNKSESRKLSINRSMMMMAMNSDNSSVVSKSPPTQQVEVMDVVVDQGHHHHQQQQQQQLIISKNNRKMMERKISARTEVGMSLEKLTIKEGTTTMVGGGGQSVIQSPTKWNVINSNENETKTGSMKYDTSCDEQQKMSSRKQLMIINKSGDSNCNYDSALESCESDPNSPELIIDTTSPTTSRNLLMATSKQHQQHHQPNNAVLVLLAAEQQHQLQLQQQQQATNNAMRRYSTSVISGGGGHLRTSPTASMVYPWMTSGKRSLDTDTPIDLSKRIITPTTGNGSAESDDHEDTSPINSDDDEEQSQGMFNADGSFNFNHPFCPPPPGVDVSSDSRQQHPRQDYIPIPLQSGSEDGEGKCVCTTCGKIFPRPSQLRIHMNIHYIERQYKCDECGVSFRSAGHLSKHKRSNAHEEKKKMNATFGLPNPDNPRPFKCIDCKTSFRIHGHLAKHLRSKLHIMKLECLSKVPFGLYAEMERTNFNPNDIDTSDCENCLISLQQLSCKMFPSTTSSGNHASGHGSGSGSSSASPTNDVSNPFAVPRTNSTSGNSMSSTSSLNSFNDEGVGGSISGSQSLINSSNLLINQSSASSGLSSKRVKTEMSPMECQQMMRERSMSFSGPVGGSFDGLHHGHSSFGGTTTSSDFMERRNTIVSSDYHRFVRPHPSFALPTSPPSFAATSASSAFSIPFPVVSSQTSSSTTTTSGTSTSTVPLLRSNTCDICHQVFKSAKSLQVHLYTDHPEAEEDDQADDNQKQQSTKTSPRPYICSVCDAGFSSPSQLTQHIPSHSVLQQVR